MEDESSNRVQELQMTVTKLQTLFEDNWHECLGGIKLFSSKLVVVLAMGKSAKEKLLNLAKLESKQSDYKIDLLDGETELKRSLNFVKTANFFIV